MQQKRKLTRQRVTLASCSTPPRVTLASCSIRLTGACPAAGGGGRRRLPSGDEPRRGLLDRQRRRPRLPRAGAPTRQARLSISRDLAAVLPFPIALLLNET